MDLKKTIENLKRIYFTYNVPTSKDYFRKKIIDTLCKVVLNKEDLRTDNEFEIKLSSLIEIHPIISEFIEYRGTIKNFDHYINTSFSLFEKHIKQIKNENILHSTELFGQKNHYFANNIARAYTSNFYSDIESILFMIEKYFSIELYNSLLETEEIVLDFKDCFNSQNQFEQLIKLLNDKNFIPQNTKLKPIEFNTLILKIYKLKLFKNNLTDQQILSSGRKYFNIEKIGSYSRLKTSYNDNSMTNIDSERFDKLDYLNQIKV